MTIAKDETGLTMRSGIRWRATDKNEIRLIIKTGSRLMTADRDESEIDNDK